MPKERCRLRKYFKFILQVDIEHIVSLQRSKDKNANNTHKLRA
jgi:hypothetical protein